ncbi:MAG: DUF2207 domain-containing protein [Patescibacteria group bacterium]
MKSFILTLLLSFGILFLPSPINAASSSTVNVSVTVNGKTIVNTSGNKNDITVEQIRSYTVDSIVKKDGFISVTEHILYNFPDDRHGIYRYIPYIKTNVEGKRLKLTFENIRVVDEKNNAYTFATSYDDDDVVLKIGDPDKSITGEHMYVISYDVKGGLTYFPAHDELYWNAIGPEWKIPTLTASASVTVPPEINTKDIQFDCFVGSEGSKTKFCTTTIKGSVVMFKATRPLGPYEAMTVVVGFPKGIVAKVNPTEIVPFFDTTAGKIVLVVLLIAAIFWYIVLPCIVVWKWWTTGRDPKPMIGQAVAWYSPPKTKRGRALTPAETGTLIDEVANIEDIYASLVDLARRGYFKIIETKKGEFDLEKASQWPEEILQTFETKLLEVVFKSADRVKLKDIKLYDSLSELNDMIYKNVVAEGFFPINPQTIRNKYVALTVLALISFNPVLFIASWMFGMHMPKKTLYGAEAAAKARALKNFLKSQDKHLAFQAKEKFMFEKLLPFAIAFGVEVIWAKRFKDMNLPQPDWYVSHSSSSHFSSVVFANSLHTGYSMSFASSVSYKSSSGYHSGFSGSGGFSGGGGGGGGGGSW